MYTTMGGNFFKQYHNVSRASSSHHDRDVLITAHFYIRGRKDKSGLVLI